MKQLICEQKFGPKNVLQTYKLKKVSNKSKHFLNFKTKYQN